MLSTLRGGAIGAVAGFTFHLLRSGNGGGGFAARSRQGSVAAFRLSGLFAAYSGLRGVIKRFSNRDALACMGAGGAVVCGTVLADASRLQFLQQYYGSILGKGGPAPVGLCIVSSFASGAFLLGGIDLALLHGAGVQW